MADTQQLTKWVAQLADHRARARARRALRELGAEAAPVLLSLLADPETPENARWSAVVLLGECRCQTAIPALLRVLRDEPPLRGDANRALMAITGRTDMAEDAEEWERLLAPAAAGTPAAPAAVEPAVEPAVRPEIELLRQALGDAATRLHWEDAGYAYVRLALGEGRKHQVIVMFDQPSADGRAGGACVYTECGPVTPRAAAAVARRNTGLAYGQFAVDKDETGAGKVVMRHWLAAAELVPEHIRQVVLSMAIEADHLEYELSQGDQL